MPDEPTVTTASILAGLSDDGGPLTDPGEKEEEPVAVVADEEEVQEPEASDGEAGGEDDEETEGDLPQLDMSALDGLSDKRKELIQKRWDQQVKGLQKIQKRVEGEVTTLKPKAEAWDAYEKVLGDKAHAPSAVQQIIRSLASYHGMDPADFIGELIPKAPENTDDWEKAGFASPQEHKLSRDMAAMQKRFDSELASRDAKLAEIDKERQENRKRAETQDYVDKVSAKTTKTFELETAGRFKPSKGMIGKAIAMFPQLRDDPVKAVKAAFPDDYAKAKYGERNGKRAPDLQEANTAHGKRIELDPDKVNTRSILEEMVG